MLHHCIFSFFSFNDTSYSTKNDKVALKSLLFSCYSIVSGLGFCFRSYLGIFDHKLEYNTE